MNLYTTAAIIFVALASVSGAGTFEGLTGCATKPVVGSNATQLADVTCLAKAADDNSTATHRGAPVLTPPFGVPDLSDLLSNDEDDGKDDA